MVVFEFVSLSASIATSRNRLLRSVCFLEDTAAGGGGDEVAVMVAGGQGVIAVWPLSHRSASRVNASATKVRCVVLGCPLVVGGLTLSEPAGGHEGHLSATTIFGCGDGSSVRGWNAINGELLLQLQVDPAAKEIPCLAYDEASATLFVGSCVGVVNVFDVSTGDFLREIKGHGPSTRVNGMCHVTTDRQVGWILTAGDDGEVRW
jgi:WD40 repeat protein